MQCLHFCIHRTINWFRSHLFTNNIIIQIICIWVTFIASCRHQRNIINKRGCRRLNIWGVHPEIFGTTFICIFNIRSWWWICFVRSWLYCSVWTWLQRSMRLSWLNCTSGCNIWRITIARTVVRMKDHFLWQTLQNTRRHFFAHMSSIHHYNIINGIRNRCGLCVMLKVMVTNFNAIPVSTVNSKQNSGNYLMKSK